MSVRIVAVATAVLVAAGTAPASAAEVKPIRHRVGVVVAWEAGSRSNVVSAAGGRVYVISSLRRYRPGTRVRIRGIKWGSAVRGVKWGVRPLGVKWGIRYALNGTYRSRLTVLGRQQTMALRGVVLRRWRGRAVALSFRGAVIFLPIARRAVWLPRATRLKAGTTGAAGSVSRFRIRVLPGGRLVVTSARDIAPPSPGRALPVAGTVRSVDAATGVVVVDATKNRRYPLLLRLIVPASVDLARYTVGGHVSALVIRPPGSTESFVTQISLDATFAQADDPQTSVVAGPGPDLADLTELRRLRDAWDAGHLAGRFTAAGETLYQLERARLDEIEIELERQVASAGIVPSVDEFIAAVRRASSGSNGRRRSEHHRRRVQIDPVFQAAILAQAEALRANIAS